MVGTMRYMAPEIFQSGGADSAYKEPLDMWSAGIIMYQLFSGRFPFEGPDLEGNIVTEEPSFWSNRWSTVSPEAKDLCK